MARARPSRTPSTSPQRQLLGGRRLQRQRRCGPASQSTTAALPPPRTPRSQFPSQRCWPTTPTPTDCPDLHRRQQSGRRRGDLQFRRRRPSLSPRPRAIAGRRASLTRSPTRRAEQPRPMSRLTVTNPAGAQTLFSASATPATVNVSDTSAVEFGVKFTADANGVISGIRFYKGPRIPGPTSPISGVRPACCSPPRPSPAKRPAAGSR